MTLVEIENKITEYTQKLGNKILKRRKGNKYKEFPIPIHLRTFYLNEIAELEKLKDQLKRQLLPLEVAKDIERKIIRYKQKLEQKTKVRTENGFKLLPIPDSQKEYLLIEIAKLEKLKSQLLTQYEESTVITWNNIMFEDGRILLILKNSVRDYYSLPQSRKSFELLKPYFSKFEIPHAKAIIINNKIKTIENINEITVALNILSIQEELSKDLFNFPDISFSSINRKYINITNNDISKLYKLKEKSKYIRILCELQSESLKIIPITELSVSKAKGEIFDDSFLFSVEKDNIVFIIWESAEINKATYVFKTNNNNYFEIALLIFHYITSDESTKRLRLRKAIKERNNKLGVLEFIDHDSLEQWVSKLNQTINV